MVTYKFPVKIEINIGFNRLQLGVVSEWKIRYFIGDNVEYHLGTANCEHFCVGAKTNNILVNKLMMLKNICLLQIHNTKSWIVIYIKN